MTSRSNNGRIPYHITRFKQWEFFQQRRNKNFLPINQFLPRWSSLWWFADSSSFKNKIFRQHIQQNRSLFHEFSPGWDPSKGRRGRGRGTIDLLRQSKREAAGLLPRKELRVSGMEKRWKKVVVAKTTFFSRNFSREWLPLEVDDAMFDERKRISSSHRWWFTTPTSRVLLSREQVHRVHGVQPLLSGV